MFVIISETEQYPGAPLLVGTKYYTLDVLLFRMESYTRLGLSVRPDLVASNTNPIGRVDAVFMA